MPAHWLDWIPSGLFFAAVAVIQLMWAFLVWSRPRPLLLALGISANAAWAALWVASRTVGLPFGPHAGAPESVDGASICVLLLECYVIMGAGWAWLQDYEPEAVSRFRSALVMLGANGLVAGTVCVGMASGFQGHHHEGPMEAQRGPRTGAAHHHDPVQHHDEAPQHEHGEPAVVHDSPPATPPDSAPDDAGLPVTDMGLHIPQETDPVPPENSPQDSGHGDHSHE